MLVLQDQERLSVWREVLIRTRQHDELRRKGLNLNNDSSAVAMLKQGNWQERESVLRCLETIERGHLCDDPQIPEWLQEFRENLVDDEIPSQGGSHASSCNETSLEPTSKRREDLCRHVFILISLKTEIARSVSGPKLQGLRAQDAMAKPYLEL